MKMRTSFPVRGSVTLALFFCLLVVVSTACAGPASSGSSKPQSEAAVAAPSPTLPAPTPNTTYPKTAVVSIPTAIYYYQAIKLHDFAKAAQYLDPAATVEGGKKLDQQELKLLASSEDSALGAIDAIEMTPGSSDGTQIVTTITRGSGNRYHSHLTLKKDGSSWKIVSIDRV